MGSLGKATRTINSISDPDQSERIQIYTRAYCPNIYIVARGENADWQRCERMTDRVVFSWYVANLGAAAAGVCLRAHSQPKKTEQVAALQ